MTRNHYLVFLQEMEELELDSIVEQRQKLMISSLQNELNLKSAPFSQTAKSPMLFVLLSKSLENLKQPNTQTEMAPS